MMKTVEHQFDIEYWWLLVLIVECSKYPDLPIHVVKWILVPLSDPGQVHQHWPHMTSVFPLVCACWGYDACCSCVCELEGC